MQQQLTQLAVWGPAGSRPAPPAATAPECVRSEAGPGPPVCEKLLLLPLHFLNKFQRQPLMCTRRPGWPTFLSIVATTRGYGYRYGYGNGCGYGGLNTGDTGVTK
eukprot:scaffold21340_cov22-Tisochrysis_lutea.AAC.3